MIARFFDGRECFFVQVGSNDGVRGDPLHDLILANPRWRGIFIEPMDEHFARLVKTYEAHDRFAFEHVAISDTAGHRPFYYVSAETILAAGMSDWYDQIGSFSRDHVLKHLDFAHVDDPLALVSERRVRCDTLTSVLDRHRVERIDVLHIDVEGYDYAVLRQIDFARFRPKLILYEHRHLGDADRAAAASLLWGHGYRLIDCGLFDTMAVRRS
jgi:FkbM family methyltransferase